MMLKNTSNGERVKLLAVDGGCNLQCRLAGMGLVPGMDVTVISNIPGRPLIIETYGIRLTLCQKMASRIRVLKTNGTAVIRPEHQMTHQMTHQTAHQLAYPKPGPICEAGGRCHRKLCCLRQMQVNQTGTIRSVKAQGRVGPPHPGYGADPQHGDHDRRTGTPQRSHCPSPEGFYPLPQK